MVWKTECQNKINFKRVTTCSTEHPLRLKEVTQMCTEVFSRECFYISHDITLEKFYLCAKFGKPIAAISFSRHSFSAWERVQ